MWFFTLNYANGPGHADHVHSTGERQNPRGKNYMDPLFRQPATVSKEEETHSGEVGVYASGPYSHVNHSMLLSLPHLLNFFSQIFSGVYEQSFIAHAMAYATCLGPKDFEKHPQCTDVGSGLGH